MACSTRRIGETKLEQNELVVLAVGDHRAKMQGVGRGKDYLLDVRTEAAATFPEEVAALNEAGNLRVAARSGSRRAGNQHRGVPGVCVELLLIAPPLLSASFKHRYAAHPGEQQGDEHRRDQGDPTPP